MVVPTPEREPVQRRSLATQVADCLRSQIFSGNLTAGTVLRQAALAREYGVSVIPLREALRQLEGEGLVQLEPHRGAVVAPVNGEDVGELIALCSALEKLAYPLSFPRLTDADVAGAEALLAELREESDVQRFGKLAWELLAALLQRAESPRLIAILEGLHRGNRRYYAVFQRDAAARAWVLDSWTQLLRHARARDGEAAVRHSERKSAEALAIARGLLPSSSTAPREERP